MGVRLALAVSPLTTAVMSSVEYERAGTASGVNNTMAQVAALLVLAISTLLFQRAFDTSSKIRLAVNGISSGESSSIWHQRRRLGAISTLSTAGRLATIKPTPSGRSESIGTQAATFRYPLHMLIFSSDHSW